MNRRNLIGSGFGTAAALTMMGARQRECAAASATPAAEQPVLSCDLDLDAADLSVTMTIPESIDEAELENVEHTLTARVHALGWSACSLDRAGRELFLNVQFPNTPEPPEASEIAVLLREPGRIDLVDGGQGSLSIGDRIVTTPLPPDAPEINIVYTTIVSNGDFLSVTVETTDFGQDVVRYEISAEAADRLAEFTRTNVGSQMPLVVDGVVVANPIIQTEISDSFDLQTDDPILDNRVVVYAAALPYPQPLEISHLSDVRATPEP